MRLPTPNKVLLFSLPWAVFLYVVLPLNSLPAEDASILFSYARNLAQTGVVSYYPGGLPAEGTSDWLFLGIIALLGKIGMGPFMAALFLSFVASLLSAQMIVRISGRKEPLPVFLLTALYFTAIQHFAGTAGYSTIVFGACVLFAVQTLLNGPRGLFPLALILTAFVRIEGMLLAVALFAASTYPAIKSRNYKSLIRDTAVFLIIIGGFFLWRKSYFGHWMPLPYYVKISDERFLGAFDRSSFFMFWHYIKHYSWPLLLMALFAVVRYARRVPPLLLLITASIIALNVISYIGFRQEMNLFYRYQFMLFLGVLLLWAFMSHLAPVRNWLLLSSLVLVFQLLHFPASIENTLGRKGNNVYSAAVSLGDVQRKGTLATTEAGYLSWLPGWVTYDLWGLNTPAFALDVVSSQDILDIDPDLLIMHARNSDYRPFFQSDTLISGEGRSWDNMCIEIARAVREAGQYEMFLLPHQAEGQAGMIRQELPFFLRPFYSGNTSGRKDAIFLSRNYAGFIEVERIILNNGGSYAGSF